MEDEQRPWPPQLRLAVWILAAAALLWTVAAAVTGDAGLLVSAGTVVVLVAGLTAAARVLMRRR